MALQYHDGALATNRRCAFGLAPWATHRTLDGAYTSSTYVDLFNVDGCFLVSSYIQQQNPMIGPIEQFLSNKIAFDINCVSRVYRLAGGEFIVCSIGRDGVIESRRRKFYFIFR
jgi:drug/metabolite transporter superfamily protein YnfA